jgi:hypothetical protein
VSTAFCDFVRHDLKMSRVSRVSSTIYESQSSNNLNSSLQFTPCFTNVGEGSSSVLPEVPDVNVCEGPVQESHRLCSDACAIAIVAWTESCCPGTTFTIPREFEIL